MNIDRPRVLEEAPMKVLNIKLIKAIDIRFQSFEVKISVRMPNFTQF